MPRRFVIPSVLALAAHLAAGPIAWAGPSDAVIGTWKVVSHTIVFEGKPMDWHAALLKQRPCAADIVYEIHTDGRYRLNASASRCDEAYKKIQEKLYAKTQWRLEGNRITTSATNFAVGQTYTVTTSGNRMTWVGTEGQGTLVFQK
jgi:Lipocalin-like domain